MPSMCAVRFDRVVAAVQQIVEKVGAVRVSSRKVLDGNTRRVLLEMPSGDQNGDPRGCWVAAGGDPASGIIRSHD